MQERGSNRLSAHQDDQLKHEVEGVLRADRPTRADAWRDPEPVEGADGASPPPGAGDDREVRDEAFRFELARHLRRAGFPAKRSEVLRTLLEERAPDELIDQVRSLPRRSSYANVQELVAALGRAPRS